jgi:hypothetical protein
MPLTQHEFYIYHDGSDVYARRRDEPPVLAESFDTPQQAYERVQEIINAEGGQPAKDQDGRSYTIYSYHRFGIQGFHDPRFQATISDNCRAYVEEAYGRAAADGADGPATFGD